MSDAKVQVAKKAFEEMAPQINKESILGIGTGSTVNCFIEILKQSNIQFKGAVSSSEASTLLLQEFNVEIFSLNDVNEILLIFLLLSFISENSAFLTISILSNELKR